MSNYKLQSQKQSALNTKNYQTEIINFLRKLILAKNCVSAEDEEYHIKTITEIYNQKLRETRKYLGRIPALNEIIDGVFEFNSRIIWDLAYHDLNCGLGKYGYANMIDFAHSSASQNDYIQEIYDCWMDRLAFDLGFELSTYLTSLLCTASLCFYDDVNLQYVSIDTYGLVRCVNDCQNLLLPTWHYKSIARGNPFEDIDLIQRMIFVDDEINYMGKGENDE